MSAGSIQCGTALTADGQVVAGKASLMGFSVREAAAGVATGVIRNGTSTSGTPVAYFNLAAAGSETTMFDGINCPNGIYLDELTGAIDIIVYYKN